MEIDAGRAPHLTSDAMDARGDAVRFLTNQEARTVASNWQSPGTRGMPFATLASTGRVDPAELQSSIIGELTDRSNSPNSHDFRDLCDLYAWAVIQAGRCAGLTMNALAYHLESTR